jgi:dihydroxy-acid dehydratase
MTDKPKKRPEDLRSQQWFGRQDRDGFAYRSWVKGKGVPHDQFDGRPVIGICNTFSELTPCNSHFRTLAEQVKIGVYEAGGFPLEFPVMSLGETLLRPTAMLYRNLASMDVEESIRGNPIDGVVLLMGCDKTTPSLLMGASSANREWRTNAQRQMAWPRIGLGHRRVEHERTSARRYAETTRLL